MHAIKQFLTPPAGVLAVALLFSPSWPESVEVVQPVGPKADQLVIIDIFDGPTGHIYIGPMTTREVEDYQDAEPDVYRFGTTEYMDALEEMRLAEILAEAPSTGFRVTPATLDSLMKRASHFNSAGLKYP